MKLTQRFLVKSCNQQLVYYIQQPTVGLAEIVKNMKIRKSRLFFVHGMGFLLQKAL